MKTNTVKYAGFIALLCFFPLLAQGQQWSAFRVDTLGYSTDVRLKEISGMRSSKLNANRFGYTTTVETPQKFMRFLLP